MSATNDGNECSECGMKLPDNFLCSCEKDKEISSRDARIATLEESRRRLEAQLDVASKRVKELEEKCKFLDNMWGGGVTSYTELRAEVATLREENTVLKLAKLVKDYLGIAWDKDKNKCVVVSKIPNTKPTDYEIVSKDYCLSAERDKLKDSYSILCGVNKSMLGRIQRLKEKLFEKESQLKAIVEAADNPKLSLKEAIDAARTK